MCYVFYSVSLLRCLLSHCVQYQKSEGKKEKKNVQAGCSRDIMHHNKRKKDKVNISNLTCLFVLSFPISIPLCLLSATVNK